MNNQLTFTDSARNRIAEIIAEENNPSLRLRVFVQGGGCSGFRYGFTLEEDQNDDDFVISLGQCEALIDSMSMMYLQGAKIDYTEGLMGSQFVIENPTATTTCGCGSSFSI